MKKVIYPIFEKCDPPKETVNGKHGDELLIDLNNVFHHAYLDTYNEKPFAINPIYLEFTQRLTADKELRFRKPGIAFGKDNKTVQSSRLGRFFTRGILNQFFGYKWFVNVSDVIDKTHKGWTVKKKRSGPKPDYLIGNRNEVAVAEAKGTVNKVSLSSKETKKFRKQATNVHVYQGKKLVKLKSWLIINQFVSTANSNKPFTLIEDPPTDGDVQDQQGEFLFEIAREHIIQNLLRLRHFSAVATLEGLTISQTPITFDTWRCTLRGFENHVFIGRNNLFHYRRRISGIRMHINDDIFDFFDGMNIEVIKALRQNKVPDLSEGQSLSNENQSFPTRFLFSYLDDGSLLCPADLMTYNGTVEI